MKTLILRLGLFCLFIMQPILMFPQLVISGETLSMNNIAFKFKPLVVLKKGAAETETLIFRTESSNLPNRPQVVFKNERLVLSVTISPKPLLGDNVWQVSVSADYPSDISLYTLSMQLDWAQTDLITSYMGTKAILLRNLAYNQDLCPYRDKIVEYATPESSFWLIGSAYDGCSGVDRIEQNTVLFYDYRLHHGRKYDKIKHRFDAKTDSKPCFAGGNEVYSFILTAHKPLMPQINRWLGEKKAALSISNDADGGNVRKIYALYYGSSNPQSPKYLTQGIFANNLRLSNTVFGGDYNNQYQMWDALRSHGSSISYHTYTRYGDYGEDIKSNLLNQMLPYNIRMWIDHAWSNNPEDFCRSGTDPETPYYILDIINNSDVDYAWMGDVPSRNEMNAFDNPWRLPHRIYEFTGLTRPVWFFGRTRMEALEYTDHRHEIDMKYNLTRQNLDKLINDEGVCFVYTHFFFDDTSACRAFFDILPGDYYEIREDANDCFELLNEYQSYRGLWVDTTENILDRMLAIEQLKIVSVSSLSARYHTITIENGSNYDLSELFFDFEGKKILIPSLTAGNRQTFNIEKVSRNPGIEAARNVFAYYNDSALYIKSLDSEKLPPMQIKVYNTRGQRVCQVSTQAPKNVAMIPFKGYASGIYFARIKPLNGKEIVAKIMVVH